MDYEDYDASVDKETPGVMAFLAELSALSTKYNIYINGCGCCRSPYLDRTKRPQRYWLDGYQLRFDRDEDVLCDFANWQNTSE